MPEFTQDAKDDYKKLSKRHQKETDDLSKILDNKGNKMGKNYKELKGELSGNGEIRGRDGLRIVFDIATLGIRRIFVKTGHDTTGMYM